MRSLVFEGNTWLVYEDLRQRDKRLGGVITLLFLISQRHDIVIGLFVNRYEFGVLV